MSLLYAGYDPHYQFQLYHSDPSGNYSGWKATCIGANNGTAQSLLKQEFKDDIAFDDAVKLALKVMSKTMDSTTLSSDKRMFYHAVALKVNLWMTNIVEFATITLNPLTNKPLSKIYRPSDIDALLEKTGLGKKTEDKDTEMKTS